MKKKSALIGLIVVLLVSSGFYGGTLFANTINSIETFETNNSIDSDNTFTPLAPANSTELENGTIIQPVETDYRIFKSNERDGRPYGYFNSLAASSPLIFNLTKSIISKEINLCNKGSKDLNYTFSYSMPKNSKLAINTSNSFIPRGETIWIELTVYDYGLEPGEYNYSLTLIVAGVKDTARLILEQPPKLKYKIYITGNYGVGNLNEIYYSNIATPTIQWMMQKAKEGETCKIINRGSSDIIVSWTAIVPSSFNFTIRIYYGSTPGEYWLPNEELIIPRAGQLKLSLTLEDLGTSAGQYEFIWTINAKVA